MNIFEKNYRKYTVSIIVSGFLGGLSACYAQDDSIALSDSISAPIGDMQPLVTGLPDFTQLVDKVSPAVVNIRTSERISVQQNHENMGMSSICLIFPDFPICGELNQQAQPQTKAPSTERVRGEGSGFIYSADGYVLTNHHVVDGASSITVTMSNQKEFKAKLIGSDQRSDVAVLKLEANDLPFLSVADSSNIKVGQWVIAAGSPFGLQNTITAGIVSAINRDTGDYESFIQTDAAVNRGNSGGPLVNVYGQVVGINSQILSSSGAFSGIALAIPINEAMSVAEQLRSKGHVTRGRIGVSVGNVTTEVAKELGLPNNEGVLISSVDPDGAAQKSGLREGDVVLSVNGNALKDSRDFARMIAKTTPGSVVPLEIQRQGRKESISLTVADDQSSSAVKALSQTASSEHNVDKLGIQVTTLSTQHKQAGISEGVVISKIWGAAQAAGLQIGDVILQINKQVVSTPKQFAELIQKDASRVLLLVRRGSAVRYILLDLDR